MPSDVMDLAQLLADCVRLCPGATDALLVDSDGVLVESWRHDESSSDADEVAAEGLAATLSVAGFAAASALGQTTEWMLSAEAGFLVVRRVPGAQLVVILRAGSGTLAGRVRFAAKVIAGRMASLLLV